MDIFFYPRLYLFPFQGAIAPNINKTKDKDGQENNHFKKDEGAGCEKIFKYDCPGIEKNNFNIKNNKEQGNHKKTD